MLSRGAVSARSGLSSVHDSSNGGAGKAHLRQPDTAQAGEPKNVKGVGFTIMAN
jgi:hypothetical protein